VDVNQTLELVRKALATPDESIQRTAGWQQPTSAVTGLATYNLEAPAKLLYPVLSPLRNEIPRVVGQPGIQANWRAITGINTTKVHAGVGEGERGGVITHTTSPYYAAFKQFTLDDNVTFEAQWASKNFDDAKARATEGLLQAMMIQEEASILGGNASINYTGSGSPGTGTCTTPTVALVTDSDNSLTNGTCKVKCVALGFRGYWNLAGMNLGTVGSDFGVVLDPNDYAYVTKTNADASVDYIEGNISKVSAESSGVTVDSSHKSVKAYVTATPGAFGYAWYVSVNGGNFYLHSITKINSALFTADPSTTIQPGSNLSTNRSTCTYDFDGLLSIALTTGSGAYVKALATGTPGTGTKLTTNNAGGISEIDDMCIDRYNLYRLSVDEIWCNAQQMLDMNRLIIKNGGAPLIRFNLDGANPSPMIDAGTVIGSLMNPVTGTKMRLRVHPLMPNGCIMGKCNQIPYKLSGINDVQRMLLRQDYAAVEWPLRTKRWEFSVYFDGVLQHYFPPALSVIFNIAAGI
jgi:hypothetical protein